jgi:hypothetical protein
MPKNAKNNVYKEKEFEMYTLWKSMPAYFRGMKKEQLLSHGFNDPLIQKIIKIKNQTEFAKTFRIKDLGTLTDWNNKIEKNNLPIKNINDVFGEQMDVVNSKIISEPDILLKNKIKEQRKLIFSLKKENLLYKKQLKIRAQQKLKIIDSVTPPIKPKVYSIAPEKESNFFQKIKNLFQNNMR